MSENDEKEYSMMSDDEKLKEFEETLEKISVKEIVLGMMATLTTLAYRKLGVPDEQKQNISEAVIAIDSLEALIQAMKKTENLNSEETSGLMETLSSLKMTYSSLITNK